jgi:hypothetical protein
MAQRTIQERVQASQVRLVRYMYCDIGGVIRGKATHAQGLERHMADRIGQARATQAFASMDMPASVGGLARVAGYGAGVDAARRRSAVKSMSAPLDVALLSRACAPATSAPRLA